jgi:hypothetical protein
MAWDGWDEIGGPESNQPEEAIAQVPTRQPGWIRRHPVISIVVGAILALCVISGISNAGHSSSDSNSSASRTSSSGSNSLPYCPVGFVPDTANPRCVENPATQQDIQNQVNQAQAQNQWEQEQQQAQQQANNNSFEQGLGYGGSQ